MRLLLDTHPFLWWVGEPARLSAAAHAAIQDRANTLFLSAATGWEIAIKTSLGRLRLPGDAATVVLQQMNLDGLRELPVTMAHALHVSALPLLHGDPFDRLLVAQAQLEGLAIVTTDRLVRAYNVATVW